MNKFNAPTVRFHCCGTEQVFNSPRHFNMCQCGSSGFDAGDGFYQRILGHPDDVEIVGYNIDKDKEYCEAQGLKYYINEKRIVLFGSPFSITIEGPGSYHLFEQVFPDEKSIQTKDLGIFSALKDANRRIKKLLKAQRNALKE